MKKGFSQEIQRDSMINILREHLLPIIMFKHMQSFCFVFVRKHIVFIFHCLSYNTASASDVPPQSTVQDKYKSFNC